MFITQSEIITIDDNIFEPPYFHPDGNFLVTIAIMESYSNGQTAIINSHRGFTTKEAAEVWMMRNNKLVTKDPNID